MPRREFLWMSDGMPLRIAVVIGITLFQLPALLAPPPLPHLPDMSPPALRAIQPFDGSGPREMTATGPLTEHWAGIPTLDARKEQAERWEAAVSVLARGTREDPRVLLERLTQAGPVYLVQYQIDDPAFLGVRQADSPQRLDVASLGLLVVDGGGVRAIIGDQAGSTKNLSLGDHGLEIAAASRIRLLDIKNAQRSLRLDAPRDRALPLSDVFRTRPDAPRAFVATR